MSTHTAGPWQVDGSDGEVIYGTDRHGEHLIVVYEMNTNPADKKLILAAPELLEALRLTVAALDGKPCRQQARDDAMRAILKATT